MKKYELLEGAEREIVDSILIRHNLDRNVTLSELELLLMEIEDKDVKDCELEDIKESLLELSLRNSLAKYEEGVFKGGKDKFISYLLQKSKVRDKYFPEYEVRVLNDYVSILEKLNLGNSEKE